MKIGVSVFRRKSANGSHSTTQGMLVLPNEAVDGIGSHLLAVNGTLSTGLQLAPAQRETEAPTHFVSNANHKQGVRLWLRTEWIGGDAKERSKAFIAIEAEEPLNGVLTLPPVPLGALTWIQQWTWRDAQEAKTVKQQKREAGRVAAEAAREIVAVPTAKAIRAARAFAPPPQEAELIDLGDLMGAVQFVNEALATGLVIPRITEGGKVRLSLKGGLG